MLGPIFQTHVDITSVIYQKTMHNFITSSILKNLKQYHNQSSSETS
jgi:hypothetical protein